MNCPSCGAAMRLEPDKDCLTCDYCKNMFFPEKGDDGVSVFPEKSENTCPVCSIPLMEASIAKVRIQYCTQCRGMLIPMGVFLALVDELRAGQPGSLIPPPPDPDRVTSHASMPALPQADGDALLFRRGKRDSRRLRRLRTELARSRQADAHRARAGPLVSRCRADGLVNRVDSDFEHPWSSARFARVLNSRSFGFAALRSG